MRDLAEALHEVEVLHQREGGIATTALIKRPMEKEPLISVGLLEPAASTSDQPFQEASSGSAGVDV